MPWPIGPLPPASGSPITLYQWARQFPDAIRERVALLEGIGGFNWPRSTRVWGGGLVSSIEIDPDDNTKLRIHCTSSDGSAVDWIGDRVVGDGPTKKWWTNYDPPATQPYLPSFYKVALYPLHTCGNGSTSPSGADPNAGHTLHIDDNGATYLRVPNDGVLTLNGKTLGHYAGYAFEIIRASASKPEQYGYSWIMRFPPRPNSTTYGWGYVCQVVVATVTASDYFTLTVLGQTTPPIPVSASAPDVEHALANLSSVDRVSVQGADGGPFTIIFSTTVGDVLPTAVGAAITEPNNIIGDINQSFPTTLIGKDAIFTVGAKWVRSTITAVFGHTLTFADIGEEPNVNNYFTVVAKDAFWRPHFYAGGGFPRFQLELIERITRSGKRPFWLTGTPWSPATWYATLANDFIKSHSPFDDGVYGYGIPKQQQTVSECVNELCDCDLYIPDGGKEDKDSFDVDLTTLAENFCTQDADLMFAPWMPGWTLRGWQLAIESLVGAFIEPAEYTGEKAIPNFTPATWGKYHAPASSRTVTISSVDGGGVAHFSVVSMPQRTPLEGNYASLACWYALINADGSIGDAYSGTLTANTLALDAHGSDLAPILGFANPGDVGKTLIIWFGWKRKYERLVRYLYSRQVFTPAENDTGEVMPPVEEYPGDWSTDIAGPSTTASEFDERGNLQDVAQTFVANQAYRFVADFWDAPTGREGRADLLYQGIPSPTSNFPRFSKSGTASAGGSFWLDDATQSWWLSATPLVTHTGTGTTGSNLMTLKDSALYKLWPTHVANPTPPPDQIIEDQLRVSRFWSIGTRFVGMILEVAVSGVGTPEDPYVWEHRPITAQTVIANVPQVTVAPAFSATTLNRPYKIREPGASDRGAIINTFKGRLLTINHANGTSQTVTITHSDDTRLYWSPTAGVTAQAGDSFSIDEIEPGSVVHYKPSVTPNHNGFVRPEQATQDTRGQNWKTGAGAQLKNCPTIVTAYGRLRKWDILAFDVWLEMYRGINALRWLPWDYGWVSSTNGLDDGLNSKGAADDEETHPGDWGYEAEQAYLLNKYNAIAGGVAHSTEPPGVLVSIYNGGPNNWNPSGLSRVWQYGVMHNLPTCFASQRVFYVKVAMQAFPSPDPEDGVEYGPAPGTKHNFNAHGDSVIWRKWSKWLDTGPSRAATQYTTDSLGTASFGPPNFPDEPPLGGQRLLSWVATARKGLLRFDVPGGLRYTG